MGRTIEAEYISDEKVLRLAESLAGVRNHEKVRVVLRICRSSLLRGSGGGRRRRCRRVDDPAGCARPAPRWDDIDFAEKRIRIARSADAKTRKIQESKTKRAKRNVPLDPRLAKELRAYRARQEKGIAPVLCAWLFPTTRPNDAEGVFVMDQRSYVQRHFEPARKVVTKNHVTPHGLRHMWCSEAVTKYPVAYVARWAGHHDPLFTYRVYVQPFDAEEQRFAATFSLDHRPSARR